MSVLLSDDVDDEGRIMNVRNFSYSAGVVRGQAWTYFFDIDRGASVNIDGNTAGVIPTRDFGVMVERARSSQDVQAGAERIVEALENATALSAEQKAFPDSGRLVAAVAEWLQS
jgi:hypothetical protein